MRIIAGSDESGQTDAIGICARFDTPRGLACTSDGAMVVIADSANHRLRLFHTATRSVTTVQLNHSPMIIPMPEALAFARTTPTPDSVLYIVCAERSGNDGALRRFNMLTGLQA